MGKSLQLCACAFSVVFGRKKQEDMVEIGLSLMRRRPAPISFLEANMDREQGKSQHSRICLLASLTAFFWLALFYFHFAILDGNGVIDNST